MKGSNAIQINAAGVTPEFSYKFPDHFKVSLSSGKMNRSVEMSKPE
jgi:hypothetical protein